MKYILIYLLLIINTVIWFLLSILKTTWYWIWNFNFSFHPYIWKYVLSPESGNKNKVLYEYLTPYNKFKDIKTYKYKDKIIIINDFDEDYY